MTERIINQIKFITRHCSNWWDELPFDLDDSSQLLYPSKRDSKLLSSLYNCFHSLIKSIFCLYSCKRFCTAHHFSWTLFTILSSSLLESFSVGQNRIVSKYSNKLFVKVIHNPKFYDVIIFVIWYAETIITPFA